ncbi:MAG: hypothetical protein Q8T04_10835 [Bacteroidota bacterium]|nr:hypothetical protein [Bacteroidota bacterium]
MKRISVFLLFCLFLAGISVAADYNILIYGAKNGQLSTVAIQKAVDECAAAGGGRVVVPAGTFVTGTVFLKSNVNLYLENGAVLQGSKDLKDYSRDGRSPGMVYCEDAI